MSKTSGLISFFLLGMLGLASLAYFSLIFISTHELQDAQAVLVSKRERGKAISRIFKKFLDGAGESLACFDDGDTGKLEICGKKASENSLLARLSNELLQAELACPGRLHAQEQSRWTFQSREIRSFSTVASQTCLYDKALILAQKYVHFPYNVSLKEVIIREAPRREMPIIFISGYAEIRELRLETDVLMLVLGDVSLQEAYSEIFVSLELAALQGSLQVNIRPGVPLALHSFAKRGELVETTGTHDHRLPNVQTLPFTIQGVFRK